MDKNSSLGIRLKARSAVKSIKKGKQRAKKKASDYACLNLIDSMEFLGPFHKKS